MTLVVDFAYAVHFLRRIEHLHFFYLLIMLPCIFVDVEADEGDDLEFVQEYDMDEDEEDDEKIAEFISNLPNDASVKTGFGKREITFAKVLTVSKNGTKTFAKFRQSSKIGGDASTKVTGNFKTTLNVTTSASAKFAVNVTIFSKGHHVKTVVDGTAVASSSSKSKIAKRTLLQEATSDSSTTLQIPALNNQTVHVNSSIRSGSETIKLPFRSFFTLFKAGIHTATDNGIKSRTVLAGEVISRVAFANKTVSLTKSCIKAFVKTKSEVSIDDEDEASSGIFQMSLVKAKTHTWTKVISASKSQVVVDVISCTKTRTYGKSVQKGVSAIFAGSGQVSWEKSQITINAKRLQNLAPHEYGVHFINKQLESSSLIQLDMLGTSNNKNHFKMTMRKN